LCGMRLFSEVLLLPYAMNVWCSVALHISATVRWVYPKYFSCITGCITGIHDG
jgi:hypothetical protein